MKTSNAFASHLRPLKIFIAAVLGIYFVLGLATYTLFGTGEDKNMIPFFHWFLFALVPNESAETQYELRITGVNGTPLPAPIPFAHADAIVIAAHSNKARDGVRRLARALSEKDRVGADMIRQQFEAAFLPPNISYEIVALKYRPIVRFQTGTIDSTIIMGTFNTAS